jgi:hypothetical protein
MKAEKAPGLAAIQAAAGGHRGATAVIIAAQNVLDFKMLF